MTRRGTSAQMDSRECFFFKEDVWIVKLFLSHSRFANGDYPFWTSHCAAKTWHPDRVEECVRECNMIER